VFRSLWQTMLTRQTQKNAQLAVKLEYFQSEHTYKEFKASQASQYLSVLGSVQSQFTTMINRESNSHNTKASFTHSLLYTC